MGSRTLPSWDDAYRLSRALQACTAAQDLQLATALHARLLKLHHSTGFFSLWNKLLNLYRQSWASSQLAHNLFEIMPNRGAISYNILISHHLRTNCDLLQALRLVSRMLKENVKPNNITLSTLLTASKNIKAPLFVEQLHAHATKHGLTSDGFVGSGLVSGYARCRGFVDALHAFEEISEPDPVSWNVMIDACARSSNALSAVKFFSRMRCYGAGGFDCFTLTSVLKTCLEKKDLGLGLQLHACTVKAGVASETPVGNALVTMYLRCGEGLESCMKVFRGISELNIISWTALISGLMQNGQGEEAVSFYKEMLSAGVVENEFCFASILPAFGSMANLEHGRLVHARILKSEFQLDLGVGNALVDMYFKCGCSEDAQLAFKTMRSHDTVSWTVMITGLGQHGKGREAFLVLQDMGSRGFRPDSVTFLAGLSACSHGGLVDEGFELFRSMVTVYGIKPKREHYACVIDMLGRAGRLQEAEMFIREMGLESDPLAWEALLGACGMHGEKELGERSAARIMELEPQKNGPYVLLSNIYADQRMWVEKGKLRKNLDVYALRKEAARSWFASLEA